MNDAQSSHVGVETLEPVGIVTDQDGVGDAPRMDGRACHQPKLGILIEA